MNSLSVRSEYALAASLLIDPRCLVELIGKLLPEDINDGRCRAIYQTALTLRENGESIDATILCDKASKLHGGVDYQFCAECMAIECTAANIADYAEIIRESARKRKLESVVDAINDSLYNHESTESIIAQLREAAEEITANTASSAVSSIEMAKAWKAYNEKVTADPSGVFVKTGMPELDTALGGGMFNSGFYIIGARPGMGKTTLGVGIAENIAESGNAVLFVSLEMSREQIMAKRLARKTMVDYNALMTGRLRASDAPRVFNALEKMGELPFYLSDATLCRVSDIENMARSVKDLKCIVLDYFGLLSAEEGSGVRSRYEETTDISKALKALAKKLKLPILCLCQLNRENQKSKDKRPKLSDLRDTGALEQDADAIILLHRENYYDDRHEDGYSAPETETIELDIAKNRHAAPSTVKMTWLGASGSIIARSNRTDEPPKYRDINYDEELPF